jgi:hypothetical protein
LHLFRLDKGVVASFALALGLAPFFSTDPSFFFVLVGLNLVVGIGKIVEIHIADVLWGSHQ